MAVTRQEIKIGHAQGTQEHAVQNRAAVDEHKLLHRGAARIGGQGGIAREPQPVAFDVDLERVCREISPKDTGQPPMQCVEKVAGLGIGAEDQAGGFAFGHFGQGKADGGFGHGKTAHDVSNCLGLGAVGAQEFQPGGGGVEKIAQFNDRALLRRRWARAGHPAPGHGELRAIGRVGA